MDIENDTIKLKKHELEELLEKAHMAGQRNQGVDPSYYEAMAWTKFKLELMWPMEETP